VRDPRRPWAALLVVTLAWSLAHPAAAKSERVRTGVGEGAPGDAVYSSSSDPLASDELQVTLQPGHGARFLKIVDQVMGTETGKDLGRDRFIVRQGPRGNRDDFASFFAAMPWVKEVKPRPKRRLDEQMPRGKFKVGAGALPQAGPAGEEAREVAEEAAAGESGASYVPGEILVKFKRGTSQKDINQFLLQTGTKVLSRLDLGEDRIYKLQVPEGVEVPDLATEFSSSPIVEYAEPNFKMSIPPLAGAKPAKPAKPTPPRQPALPELRMSTDELLGDSVFVTFRPGVREPIPELVGTVYGVELQEEDNGRVRYSLPQGANPRTAARLFKLCPYVMGAEPSYGR